MTPGLIAGGLSNREVASALAVEQATIRTHVKRILMRLELRYRVQAVIFAYEAGRTRSGGPTLLTSTDDSENRTQ
jgi:DNA-binding NarL/FixJ family response regulator